MTGAGRCAAPPSTWRQRCCSHAATTGAWTGGHWVLGTAATTLQDIPLFPGILIYEMVHGYPPFYDESNLALYRKILTAPLHWRLSTRDTGGRTVVTCHNLSRVTCHVSGCRSVRDLVRRLVTRDTTRRLGCMKRGSRDVMEHRSALAIVLPRPRQYRRGLTCFIQVLRGYLLGGCVQQAAVPAHPARAARRGGHPVLPRLRGRGRGHPGGGGGGAGGGGAEHAALRGVLRAC